MIRVELTWAGERVMQSPMLRQHLCFPGVGLKEHLLLELGKGNWGEYHISSFIFSALQIFFKSFPSKAISTEGMSFDTY